MACSRIALLLALLCHHGVHPLPTSDLYPFGVNQDHSLPKENDISSAEVQLSHPVTFYGTEYSTLYVNDNGLVSFLTEVPSFFSAQFPLPYPLIAPLYCDVDTRGAGRVFYRETQDEGLLLRFSALVAGQFAGSPFRARSLFVATWDGVGAYEQKADKVNTFQLVIGFEERDAYALLLYPESGIQWIQADGKVPSLPDAKAQAGFMAGDGTRYTLLRGSGTDHVVNLDNEAPRLCSETRGEGLWGIERGVDDHGGLPESLGVTALEAQAHSFGSCYRCSRGIFRYTIASLPQNRAQRAEKKKYYRKGHVRIKAFSILIDSVCFHHRLSLKNMNLTYLFCGAYYESPYDSQAVGGPPRRGGPHLTAFPLCEVLLKRSIVATSGACNASKRENTVERTYYEGRGNLETLKVAIYTPEMEYKQSTHEGTLSLAWTNRRGCGSARWYTLDCLDWRSHCPSARAAAEASSKAISLRQARAIASLTKLPSRAYCTGLHAWGTSRDAMFAIDYKILNLKKCTSICHVNECISGQHNCHVHAECMNLEGSFACRCRPGYNGNGVHCQAEATCASLRCDPAAECVQPSPDQAPRCRCPAGFTGDGSVCVPSATDCRQSPLMCDVNAQCEYDARARSYGCRCRSGWRGDGTFCVEQSCLEADDCHPDAQCVYDRQVDAYFCACNPGFSGDGYLCYPHGRRPSCDQLHDCHPKAQCVFNATAGLHQCRCTAGYRGDGYQCVQLPEGDCGRCAPVGGACVRDAEGRPSCRCLEGFEGDGRVCRPMDECSTPDHCDPHAQCVYDGRRYRCQCGQGYRGDGKVCEQLRPDPGTPCNLVNQCSASAQCVYDPASRTHRCVCEPGTRGDGYRCVAPASCSENPSLCSANADCVRQPGGEHVCQCQPGFTGDGRVCAPAPRGHGDYLLFGQGMSILQMPLVPTKGNPGKLLLMEQHQTVVGLAADCADGHIYWTDAASGTIRRAFANGSSPETFRAGLRSPEGIAVDWASRNIFWTDSLDDTVEVASLDGAYHHVIVHDGLVNPRGIAVHPSLGKVYWTDWDRSRPRIEACHMDGTGRSVLVEGGGLELPNMLALDLEHNDLCWTDAGRRTVECVNLSGGGRRTVYTPAQYPFGLALAAGKVYWTDWAIPFIHTVDRNGGTAEPLQLPLGGNGKLYGITAVTVHCPQLANACSHQNGGCRHLCLPSGQWGRTCHCGGNSTACNEVNA
ncbi:unnamed protein product [Ixodes hexagonus]